MALEFCLRAREIPGAHGGEVVKTLGDGVMLRFDDAGAAVRMGLELVEGLAAVPGFPAVRVGMHTGGTATGTAPRSTSPVACARPPAAARSL